MTPPHLPYWLAATYLPGVGPRTFMRWLEQFSDIEKLFHAAHEELQVAGLSPQQIQSMQNPDWKSVEKDLEWAQVDNQHLISPEDDAYPRLLKEIHDPPLVLYVRGNKTVLSALQLAVVGSRNATSSGLKDAWQFAHCLAERGFAITSGLALGIDGAAHRGALSGKGITIGVMGTGLNHIYPLSHGLLAEEMISNQGAVISEFSLNTPPQATNFPRRNRVISGLSVGVLVVEAALKSGSLITARHSLEQGREVFAIPGSIHNPLIRGCHHLIRQGAKLVETAGDILEELGALRAAGGAVSQSKFTTVSAGAAEKGRFSLSEAAARFVNFPGINFPDNLAPEFRSLLEQIEYEITPIDMIILRSGLTAGEVSSILLSLELHGYIQSVPGGYVRTVAN